MLLNFDSIRKEYADGTVALDNVSFGVDAGEFVFVVGPSGAGKTTLLKLILREEFPSEGSLFFEDKEIPKLSSNEVSKLRRQIGVVFQEFRLIPSRTVLENVLLPLEITDDSASSERALEILELLDLADRAQLFPSSLSGGEKQRVSFARALVHKPRVLLADEPTGNIGPQSSQKISNVLAKANEAGTTIFVCTHDENMVNTLRRRVLRLESGRLVADKKGGTYQ
ncbi:MAG: cell division ATP-binding protein FtsE [Patescibacteria group bacterium]